MCYLYKWYNVLTGMGKWIKAISKVFRQMGQRNGQLRPKRAGRFAQKDSILVYTYISTIVY